MRMTNVNFKLVGIIAFAAISVGALCSRAYRRYLSGRNGEDGNKDAFSESELAFLALESNNDSHNDEMSASSSDVLLKKSKKSAKSAKKKQQQQSSAPEPVASRKKKPSRSEEDSVGGAPRSHRTQNINNKNSKNSNTRRQKSGTSSMKTASSLDF